MGGSLDGERRYLINRPSEGFLYRNLDEEYYFIEGQFVIEHLLRDDDAPVGGEA